MTFEEKTTWVAVVVTTLVSAVYYWVVLSQLGEVPAAEIAYQAPLVIAVVATIILTIIGAIGTAIGTAIASAVSAEISGGEPELDDIGRTDERDVDISRRGARVGYYVSSAGAVIVLGMTMLEYDYFWIANALYAAFLLGSIVSSLVALAAYRRGF
ncbi:MAG: hypothetical protein U1E26_08580 [Coriobacteriia bacterium]|nr:hypothetical protein [Coriobacteriia bacterium]